MVTQTSTRYRQPDPSGLPAKALVVDEGTANERQLVFFDRIELGRDLGSENFPSGKVLLGDGTVSSRHCIVTQRADGRCFVRDVSRNGTRLDGRRLVPNLEFEITLGQVLTLGEDYHFCLRAVEIPQQADADEAEAGVTMKIKSAPIEVTVLVGDIRDYTVMVREAPADELQSSVARVFTELEHTVTAMGGTLKEYQGDAIFAYWEAGPNPCHAEDASRAALRLAEQVEELAGRSEVWNVSDHELGMDWALATGQVLVQVMGGDSPTGLSMIGKPVVLAFRLEKVADRETGPIVASGETRRQACSRFRFRDLGNVSVTGFEQPERAFALLEEIEEGAEKDFSRSS